MNNEAQDKSSIGVRAHSLSYSEDLRIYMLSVYNYMALGLGFTGSVALLVVSSPALLQAIMPMMMLFVIAPVALVLFLSLRINTLKYKTAQALFWAYAGLNGVAFSVIFMAYTYESIGRVFFITAAMFAAMSLYGYTTRKDLTDMGSFLFMGLVGLIIASLVNIFISSSLLQFLVSILGVLIFTGLTAYDTQRIKESYREGSPSEVAGKKAIFGALQLYLDFINLFFMMLRLVGDRR